MAATATATPTTRRKRRGRRGKVSGYFRSIFETEPGSFKKSNAELIERWIQDHPSHTQRQLKKVKANLANLRSHIRHKEGGGRKYGGRRGGRAAGTAVRPSMELLEHQIDECLTLARNLDRQGLEAVIDKLRNARNEVVVKQGAR